MRSGDSFVTNGDLIDGLKFTVKSGKKSATMGQTLKAKPGKTVTITIAIHSPRRTRTATSRTSTTSTSSSAT